MKKLVLFKQKMKTNLDNKQVEKGPQKAHFSSGQISPNGG